MSRRISNTGLAKLIKSYAHRHRDEVYEPGFCLRDLAGIIGKHERSIYYYSTGRQQQPLLEQKLATLFGLSVSQLRSRLNLTTAQGRKHAGHGDAASKKTSRAVARKRRQ